MSKRDQVKYVKKAAPVKTFLAHWGLFLTLHILLQVGGFIVVYPKPVQLVEASQEDGGLLSALGVR